jgi:hypothetical protein
MKLSLYNIQTEYLQLAEQLIENGGELTPELTEALAINQANLETKSTNYGLVIKQWSAEADIIDAEIDRLTTLKKQRLKAVERLENNISQAMQLYNVDKIETPILKISFRKSESVEINNMAQIDAKFLNEKVTVTPDKKAIKDAIKAGETVEGATLIINQNIQIK